MAKRCGGLVSASAFEMVTFNCHFRPLPTFPAVSWRGQPLLFMHFCWLDSIVAGPDPFPLTHWIDDCLRCRYWQGIVLQPSQFLLRHNAFLTYPQVNMSATGTHLQHNALRVLIH